MVEAPTERHASRQSSSPAPRRWGKQGVFFPLCALLVAGCSQAPRPASNAEPAPPQVAPAPPKTAEDIAREDAAVPVSADRSFDPAVYAAGNLPPLDTPWTPLQYATAAEALTNVARQNRLFLPRENSERSGVVFARLMSRDNFEALTPQAANDYLQILPRFFALYAPSSDGAAFPREQVRWAELLLWLYPRALHALAEGHKAGVVPEQPLLEQRTIAVAVVRGAAQMLRETERYRTSDRALLEDSLTAAGPALRPELTPAQSEAVAAALPAR